MRAAFDGIGMTSRRTRDRLVRRLEESGIADPRVLDAVREVPRHLFVDEALASRAYDDTALPIGAGQTISQPYVVARMTAALVADPVPARVLEIGTGSGYQTAVLARLVERVYTLERIDALLRKARERFHSLRLDNVRAGHADGTVGWPEHAPFDAIMVTAAPLSVPDALFEQLAPGGRLVAPVGPEGEQELVIFRRADDGLEREVLDRVSFVPVLKGTR